MILGIFVIAGAAIALITGAGIAFIISLRVKRTEETKRRRVELPNLLECSTNFRIHLRLHYSLSHE